MNTPIDSNDPRLTDFVLGELDENESFELERLLQAPENAEALREVEALRELVRTANAALQADAAAERPALSQAGRSAILEEARTRNNRWGIRWNSYRLTALAATLLLCLGGAWLYVSVLSPEAATQRAMQQAEREEIAALQQRLSREMPIERYLVTDIDSPAESLHSRDFDLESPEGRAAARDFLDTLKNDAADSIHISRLEEAERHVPPPPSPATIMPPPPSPTPEMPSQPLRMVMPDEAVSPGLRAAEVGDSIRIAGQYPSHQEPTPQPRVMPKDWDSWDRPGIDFGMPELSPPIMPPPDRRPYPGGEQYSIIEERPFANAAEQPLSTFSLHADSAAYANIRRLLQQGQMPPRDAVRIEEIINYFEYDYPQPKGELPFTVNIEVGPCPWASGHLLAKIGLQGREVPEEERPPANLVFLIDTSGSMNRPNRLPLVKESLKALLEQLQPTDRVGIVTYAGQSLTALESTPLSDRNRIVRTIDALHAAGSTHGSAGIQDAYAMAQKHFIEGGINRVILATDGDFNVGITSREGLLALIGEKRQSGVFLTVLGYGMGNLKDGTLELLATKGNGNYAYIDNYSEARRVLVEQLSGTLVTIAKDTRIQVEFNPAHVRSYRLLGYENRMMAHRDFHDDTKDAGEIGAGHTVTALYQIVPRGVPLEPGVDDLRYQAPATEPPPEENMTGEMMFVKLRYKHPDSDTSRLIEIPVPAHALSLEQSSADYRFAAAAAGFGLLLRDSAYKGDADYDLVRELAATAVNNDHRREELLNLIVTAKTMRNR